MHAGIAAPAFVKMGAHPVEFLHALITHGLMIEMALSWEDMLRKHLGNWIIRSTA